MKRITTPAEARASDPIVRAIAAYENGAAAFECVEPGTENDSTDLWDKPLQVLKNWQEPIHTRRGAILALRLLASEAFLSDENVTAALLPAVIAFLERQPLQPADIDQKLFSLWRELEQPLTDLAAICTAVRALADRLGQSNSEISDALNFLMDHASERTGFVSDLRDDLQALFVDWVQPAANLEAAQ